VGLGGQEEKINNWRKKKIEGIEVVRGRRKEGR
jgi:hypothetical protein